MRTSFSALETYTQCPLKYKFQEIDKIRTPRSPEALFGTIIHGVLKFIHTRQQGEFPKLQNALEFFQNKWNDAQLQNERQKITLLNQGKNIIEKYYHDNDITTSTPISTEMFFETPIETPTCLAVAPNEHRQNEIHTLAGKIDRIDKLEDGSFEIIDYKTSKWLPSQEDVDNNLQLAIYQMGLLNRWPNIDTPIKVSLYFLLHGMKLSSTKSPDTTATQDKVSNIIKSIQETKEFKPLPGILCGWCGHQKMCPMFAHKFKKEEELSADDIDIKTVMKDFFAIKEQESENKKQLTGLKEKINTYCDAKKVERIFADDGSSITRSAQKRFGYDWDVVSDILQKNNKWKEVYSPDKIKLKTIMPTLPSADFEKIEKTKKIESEYTVLKVEKSDVV